MKKILTICLVMFFVTGLIYPATAETKLSEEDVKRLKEDWAEASGGAAPESPQGKLSEDVQRSQKMKNELQKERQQEIQKQMRKPVKVR